MFTDPVSIVFNTYTKQLPRIGTTADGSTYRTHDGQAAIQLQLSHAFKQRTRAVARLTWEGLVASQLNPDVNTSVGMTATFTIDIPSAGLTPADGQHVGQALRDFLTDANILKLIQGET
jgi:hypothetical protein